MKCWTNYTSSRTENRMLKIIIKDFELVSSYTEAATGGVLITHCAFQLNLVNITLQPKQNQTSSKR